MTVEKANAFINKLTAMTKSDVIKWLRIDIEGFDPARSFYTAYGMMRIWLLNNGDNDLGESLRIDVEYDNSLPIVTLQFNDPTFKEALIQLFEPIYSSFPNIDNVIDAFLNS